MRAITAVGVDAENPLSKVLFDDNYPEPAAREGWVAVEIKAASINHHDIFNLRGMSGIGKRFPTVLGSDGAGLDPAGRRVIVHAIIADPAHGVDETVARGSSLLSDVYDGTLADRTLVPADNLLPLPDELSFEEAACLPTAFLTAFRMLFTKAHLAPGQRVLIQGAGGGVATAALLLAAAAGAEVAVTSRDEAKLARARELGASVALPTLSRLPWRPEVVIETVGAPTWEHSLQSVANEGTVVVAGSTGGFQTASNLREIYRRQLTIMGSTLGNRQELGRLLRFLVRTGVRPLIDTVFPLSDAGAALRRMADGGQFGKIVLQP